MDELTVQQLAEHLNDLAGTVDRGVEVMPVRVRRGDWRFHVTDRVGSDWVTESYGRVRQWLLSGG